LISARVKPPAPGPSSEWSTNLLERVKSSLKNPTTSARMAQLPNR